MGLLAHGWRMGPEVKRLPRTGVGIPPIVMAIGYGVTEID
jgi:hypothetical protein